MVLMGVGRGSYKNGETPFLYNPLSCRAMLNNPPFRIPNSNREGKQVEYIENRDYRLDHEKKILYMSKRLWDESYRLNSDAQKLTWKWAQQKYYVEHGCSDAFIQTGKN